MLTAQRWSGQNADSFPSLRAAARGLEQQQLYNQVKATPPAGRGKRQIRELEVLQHKAQTILKSHRVEGLLAYTYEHYPATKTVGERYQITAVTLNTAAIAQDKQTFGWRVYVTNACLEQLSFQDAVLTSGSGARVPSLQGQVALSHPFLLR